MKLKTSELTGPALDWAVAQAEGRTIHHGDWYGPYAPEATLKVSRLLSGGFDALCFLSGGVYSPSSNWPQGGPIIDAIKGFALKEWLDASPESCCEAHIHNLEGDWIEFGPTKLIAAMRCFVASKLGDEVDVPEELLS